MTMKRLLSSALALCLVLSLGVSGASAAEDTKTLETVQILGILTADERGSMNLSSQVTRAEFVKMMTTASVYKDTVGGGYGASLFKDVKTGDWATEYIRLAVEQGWVSGYVDGTFRPEHTMTLEEACAALLRLLGYDSSSLAGSFPTAQLSKASALGLLDDMTAVRGQSITRGDCATLFYNLLTAQTSEGAVYGTALGYTITNGEVDYSTLVSTDTKGPFVTDSGTLNLPFTTSGITVYRNGTASDLSAVKQYDVYYYNSGLRTVWVYNNRITGTLTAVSPNRAAPTAITVAGAEYTLGTSSVIYKFSSKGSFTEGSMVTLLLGMDGDVVDVISVQDSDTIYYGMVISSEKAAASTATSGSDTTSVQNATQVACSDGITRTFYHSSGSYTSGRLVTVTLNSVGTKVTNLSTRSLEGSVSSDGTRFANYTFADGVEILDTDSSGGYARIYPSRLAGAKLKSSDVRYYTLDENGNIDHLILENATGDAMTYAYLTTVDIAINGMNISGEYEYLLDGVSTTINNDVAYSISVGGAALTYSDGKLQRIKQLESTKLTELSTLFAMAENKKYMLDENVQVLLKDPGISGGYYATTLSEINASDYTLEGWYDNLTYSAGGRIRIIIARAI